MSLLDKLLGRPLASVETPKQKIGVIAGVSILGLDALASASYGPEAALAVLSSAGEGGVGTMPWIAAFILLLLGILLFSYWQTISAYPNGGGAYTVAKENLGVRSGLLAAAALMVDYVLNVAVAISAGVGALESALPGLHRHALTACLVILTLLALLNLRGVRDSGAALGAPTSLFVFSLLTVLAGGVFQTLWHGGNPVPVEPPPPVPAALHPVGLWLGLRAFASGCTAMTGVEAVSNAVPLFDKPGVRRAQRTLLAIVLCLALLLGGIAFLAPAYHIAAMPQEKPGYQSVLSQLVAAIAGRGVIYYVTLGSILAVLSLSANTSFADFPRLCRLLADDGFLPQAFSNLGRRLVYSFGIGILAVVAGGILIAFDGITDRLIPLFAVGAFAAFTLSQAGMVGHWWRKRGGGRFAVSLSINAVGAVSTAIALGIIGAAKWWEGAWLTLLVIPGLMLLFAKIKRHYARIARQVNRPTALLLQELQPLAVVIPINGWNRVTERAVRFGLRISSDVTAVHVSRTGGDEPLRKLWTDFVERPAREAGREPPRLEILQSPFRRLFKPILGFVGKVKAEKPDRLVAVIIPELVEPRWYEYLIHNRRAAALKALLFLEGDQRTVVINTPWYLHEG